ICKLNNICCVMRRTTLCDVELVAAYFPTTRGWLRRTALRRGAGCSVLSYAMWG
ncbi:hypothetical protein HAX54_028654, partial [Datura stramonium]|nr:hypothetical protein [Datura stramonium]